MAETPKGVKSTCDSLLYSSLGDALWIAAYQSGALADTLHPLDAQAPYSLCLAKKRASPSATARGFMSWSAWVACGTSSSSAYGVHCLSSVPPTLRAGSIKMKQDRSAAEHLLPLYPCSAGSLSSLALPALHRTGGTYGQERQEEQTHS